MIKINVTVFLNDTGLQAPTYVHFHTYDTFLYLTITGLSVQQVNPNSGRVVGIEFEGNYITLPPEMFANKMNPGDDNSIAHMHLQTGKIVV